MANRTITGTVVDEAGDAIASAVVSFTLMSPLAYRESDVVLRKIEEATTDESGAFSVSLAVPTLGAYLYRCRLPDGQVFNFTLADGSATTLSTIMASSVANSVSSANAVESLINTHNSDATAHPSIRGELVALYNAYVALDYDPSGTADAAVATHNASDTSHADIRTALSDHESDTGNPHGVTYTQVGADASGSAAAAQSAAQSYADGLASNYDASGSAAAVAADLSTHEADTDNPHSVTYTQVGAEPAITGGTATQVWTGLKTWAAGVWLGGANTWTALQTFSAGLKSAWVAPVSDGTSAFQVRKADNVTSVLTVDTTNHNVIVGRGGTMTSVEDFMTFGENLAYNGLVYNGAGLLGDNTNFANLIWDATDAYFARGSWRTGPGSRKLTYADHLIPVNPSFTYRMTVAVKVTGGTGVELSKIYVGAQEYTAEGDLINISHIMQIANTVTSLAADLNNGDNYIYLTSSANWSWNQVATRRGIVFGDYAHPTSGRDYGANPNTQYYSQNYYSSLFPQVAGSIDTGAHRIVLASPWSGGSWSAGHTVWQPSSAGLNYFASNGDNITDGAGWSVKSGTLSGVRTDWTVAANGTLSPVTAYIQPLIFLNYNVAATIDTWVSNINIHHVPDPV